MRICDPDEKVIIRTYLIVARTVRTGTLSIIAGPIEDYKSGHKVRRLGPRKLQLTDCLQEESVKEEIVLYEEYCALTLLSSSLYQDVKGTLHIWMRSWIEQC